MERSSERNVIEFSLEGFARVVGIVLMSRWRALRSMKPFGKHGEECSRGVGESGTRSLALRSRVTRVAQDEARGVDRKQRGSRRRLRTLRAFYLWNDDFRGPIDRASELTSQWPFGSPRPGDGA
jgi:hypothetical protein